MRKLGFCIQRTAAAALVMLCTGCAFGTKMNFKDTQLALPATTGEVAVAVWDSRPAVLSGDKSPEWVGLQRSGAGIPYGVHTSSGQPLRRDFASSIKTSLSRSGSTTSTVEVPDRTADEASVLKLLPAKGKAVLLQIAQWKTDTMVNVHFDYDLALSILKDGKIVTTERVQGNEKLDGSSWNPVAASERAAVAKQKEKLETLFSRPTISQALTK